MITKTVVWKCYKAKAFNDPNIFFLQNINFPLLILKCDLDVFWWYSHLQYVSCETHVCVCVCVCEFACVCVCVCVCVRVYVVYEDTNLYNDMGMTEVLQYEGVLWGHCLCPRNSKGLKNILNGVFFWNLRCTQSPVRAKFRCRVGVGQ